MTPTATPTRTSARTGRSTPAGRLPSPGSAPEWTCANCETPNLGRRRCRDCGTTRY